MEQLHHEEVSEGQGLVEYALILLLVALVVFILLVVLGDTLALTFSRVANSVVQAGM